MKDKNRDENIRKKETEPKNTNTINKAKIRNIETQIEISKNIEKETKRWERWKLRQKIRK